MNETEQLRLSLQEAEEKLNKVRLFAAEQVSAASAALVDTTEKLDAAQTELATVLSTKSWRWTSAARKTLLFLRNIKHGLTRKSFVGLASGSDTERIKSEITREENHDYSAYHSDIKPIALYLPQYHTFPENDAWWGKGFTEWTNVKKGVSRYEEHNQPRVPDDSIGYYDLSDVDTIRKQVRLAKEHGIYGFGIYYYWFSGKKLMTKPLELLLAHQEIQMPFFLIWANENWTRTWDGLEKSILISQQYTEENRTRFIDDILPYLKDERYIRIDGRPVIGVYRMSVIPDADKTIKTWRDRAREFGIGELFILSCESDGTAKDFHYERIIDGEYEFPPRNKGNVPTVERPNGGLSFDYQALTESERRIAFESTPYLKFRGAMLEWDNSARKEMNYNSWHGFTLESFYLWIRTEVAYTRKHLPPEKRFLFLNAWNEWGEGTYLEPDERYGYAAINTFSRALYGLPLEAQGVEPRDIPVITGAGFCPGEEAGTSSRLTDRPHVCVQVHAFYQNMIAQIVGLANRIPVPYDLYITTDSPEKKDYITQYTSLMSTAENVFVDICENRGRDVIPFLKQMEGKIREYDYICHIHTKYSNHSYSLGVIWREYLYTNLLGSSETISEILRLFEDNPGIGLVMPQNLDLLDQVIDWGSNYEIAQSVMNRISGKYILPRNNIIFPAGNMFWARTEAVYQVFDSALYDELVPEEKGQVDGTIMHSIERLWCYLADSNGYTYQTLRSVDDNRPMRFYCPNSQKKK